MLDKPLPRSAYKQHLEHLGDACAFCSRADALGIEEYENWVWAYSAFPYRKYHTLLISKRHIVQFSELSAKELEELTRITKGITQLYKDAEIVSKTSTLGDQLFFSWRMRDELEGEKKAVSHFHLHIYPEIGKEISIVLDQEAWDIDMARLLPKKEQETRVVD